MANVFRVRPIRPGNQERERAFAEALAAFRLALNRLEAACAEDPRQCRRAAVAVERMAHEVSLASAPTARDPY